MEKTERDAYNIKTKKRRKKNTINFVKRNGMTLTGMFRKAVKEHSV